MNQGGGGFLGEPFGFISFPPRPPPFPALGGTALRLTSLVRSPKPGSPRPARLGVVHRFHPVPVAGPKGDLRLSQVPREPQCVLVLFLDSGRASMPSLCGISVLPPGAKTARASAQGLMMISPSSAQEGTISQRLEHKSFIYNSLESKTRFIARSDGVVTGLLSEESGWTVPRLSPLARFRRLGDPSEPNLAPPPAEPTLHQSVLRAAPEPPRSLPVAPLIPNQRCYGEAPMGLWSYERAVRGRYSTHSTESKNPSGCRPAAHAPKSLARTRFLGLKRRSRAPVDRSRRARLLRISGLIQQAGNAQSRPGHHQRVDLRGRNISQGLNPSWGRDAFAL